MIPRNVCSHGVRAHVKSRVRGRLDKRMFVLATNCVYGHDGEWLKLYRDYFLIGNHGPCETREYEVFVFSL